MNLYAACHHGAAVCSLNANNTSSAAAQEDYLGEMIIYSTAAAAVLILFHSFFMHWQKFDTLRLINDIAAIACVVIGIFTCVASITANRQSALVLNKIFCNGLLVALVQLCDNYACYLMFTAMHPKLLTRKTKISILLFVLVFLVFSWFPVSVLVPPFYRHYVLPHDAARASQFLLHVFSISTVVYNFTFALKTLFLVIRLTKWESLRAVLTIFVPQHFFRAVAAVYPSGLLIIPVEDPSRTVSGGNIHWQRTGGTKSQSNNSSSLYQQFFIAPIVTMRMGRHRQPSGTKVADNMCDPCTGNSNKVAPAAPHYQQATNKGGGVPPPPPAAAPAAVAVAHSSCPPSPLPPRSSRRVFSPRGIATGGGVGGGGGGGRAPIAGEEEKEDEEEKRMEEDDEGSEKDQSRPFKMLSLLPNGDVEMRVIMPPPNHARLRQQHHRDDASISDYQHVAQADVGLLRHPSAAVPAEVVILPQVLSPHDDSAAAEECRWEFPPPKNNDNNHHIAAAARGGDGGGGECLQGKDKTEDRDVDSGSNSPSPTPSTVEERASSARVKLRIIALKCVGHATTSSFAALFLLFGPAEYAQPLWALFTLMGIHFWFNIRAETWFFLSRSPNTRMYRELNAMLNRRRKEVDELQRNLDAGEAVVAAAVAGGRPPLLPQQGQPQSPREGEGHSRSSKLVKMSRKLGGLVYIQGEQLLMAFVRKFPRRTRLESGDTIEEAIKHVRNMPQHPHQQPPGGGSF